MYVVDLFSYPDAVAIVKNFIVANPDIYRNTSQFIEGWGWDHTSWPSEQWPTAVCNAKHVLMLV
jgi:hypothetical protein